MTYSLKKHVSIILAVVTAFAACSAMAVSDLSKDSAMPIQLQNSDSLQRLNITASVIIRSQRADLSDIVIQDAAQKPMQMAWINPHDTTAQELHSFQAFPILGSQQQASGNATLRIVEQNGQRVVEFNDSAKNPNNQATIGALFDTRGLTDQQLAVSIELDAETPIGEIINLNLSTSSDLSHWENLSEASIARFKQNDGDLKQLMVELPPSSLNKQYLRIMWPDNAQVKVAKATITTKTHVSMAKPSEFLPLAVPNTSDNHLSWSFGHPIAISGVNIQTRTNSLTPLRILGRSSAEARWQLLDATVLFQITQNGQTRHNAVVKFDAAVSELRIETDKNVSLPADISVSLQVSPKEVVFLTNGTAPFSLALLPNNSQKPLNLNTLIPNYQLGDEAKLPVATFNLSGADGAPLPAVATVEPNTPYLLWGILGGGVLLLLAMVLVILKQMKNKSD